MSKKYNVKKDDLIKIGKGTLIAAIGAALTYLTEIIPSVNLGEYTPVVVAGFSILTNLIRKWMTKTN